MNIPKIADAIGYIDKVITATPEAPPKKKA